MPQVRQLSAQRRFLLTLQGIFAVVLGVPFLIAPIQPLGVVLLATGAYFVIYGLATLLYIAVRKHNWGWKIFVGSLAVIGGVAAMTAATYTGAGYAMLYYFFATQAMVGGGAEFVIASRRKDPALASLGALAFLLGLLLYGEPVLGPIWLGLFVGFCASIAGTVAILFAARGRRESRADGPLAPPA